MTARKPVPAELIEAVKAHAIENYASGWDFIVEATSDEEIAAMIGPRRTVKSAIAAVAQRVEAHAEAAAAAGIHEAQAELADAAAQDAAGEPEPVDDEPAHDETLEVSVDEPEELLTPAGDFASDDDPDAEIRAFLAEAAQPAVAEPAGMPATVVTPAAESPAQPVTEPAAAAGLPVNARKGIVATALLKVAGDLVEFWDDERVADDEVARLVAAWLNYLPVSGVTWDERLPGRTGAGRRSNGK